MNAPLDDALNARTDSACVQFRIQINGKTGYLSMFPRENTFYIITEAACDSVYKFAQVTITRDYNSPTVLLVSYGYYSEIRFADCQEALTFVTMWDSAKQKQDPARQHVSQHWMDTIFSADLLEIEEETFIAEDEGDR